MAYRVLRCYSKGISEWLAPVSKKHFTGSASEMVQIAIWYLLLESTHMRVAGGFNRDQGAGGVLTFITNISVQLCHHSY